MNAKKILVGALAAAMTVGAVAPIASAATLTVVPAAYADGFVTAVDAKAGTITVGQVTYTMRTPAELLDVTVGSEVDIAYVTQNGRRTAIAVTPIEDVEGDLVD
jgi:hypothetical protein